MSNNPAILMALSIRSQRCDKNFFRLVQFEPTIETLPCFMGAAHSSLTSIN